MKIPKEIKICGYDFEVILRNRKEDGIDVSGSMRLSEQKLWIDTNQCQEQRESALIHEIIEAINMVNDLNLSHQQICVLENNLYQVLKDNFLNESPKK